MFHRQFDQNRSKCPFRIADLKCAQVLANNSQTVKEIAHLPKSPEKQSFYRLEK